MIVAAGDGARNRRFVGGVVFLVAAVAAVYTPVLHLELTSDDYQFLQLAHAASHNPLLLFADIDQFYRPSTTWLLVMDRFFWGQEPAGYHLTNILLRCCTVLMLVAVGRKLRLPVGAAVLAAGVWALSPLSEESVVAVSIRLQELLLISWLGLILAWPRRGSGWSRRTVCAVVVWTGLAAASKETWVVTPLLAGALELARGVRDPRRLFRVIAPFAVASVVFVAGRFLLFPTDRGYFSVDARMLAKVTHQFAAFLWLEQPVQIGFTLSWRGVVALSITAWMVVSGIKRWRPATIVGVALMVAPMLPTLAVPFLPYRYTTIPYAGFLMVGADWIVRLVEEVEDRWRRVAARAAVVFALLGCIAGAAMVRADLLDHSRVSAAHRRLLDETALVAGQLPLDRPVLVIRAERDEPLTRIALSPRGLAKIYFPRHDDPYGLIDVAALFEWVLDREGIGFVRLKSPPSAGGDVLLHRSGGFVWGPRGVPDLAEEARRWRASGFRVTAVRARELR